MNVSILIPTYKRPDLIVHAINSCLEQTYAPYEIVIGDDSPDDVTADVVAEIQRTSAITIRYIHNKPSLKQAANVNMLFNAATGDKVMLLHDDDMLMPNSLDILVNTFRQHPGIQVAYGKQYIINENGVIDHASSESFNRDFYRETKYAGDVLTPFEAGLGQQFPNNGYLIDADIVKKIQWTNDAGDACDYDFGYRVGVAGYKMYFVDEYLGKYRLSDNSISLLKENDAAYQAFRIINNSTPTSPMAREIRARRLKERAPIAITGAVNMGKRKEAMSILFSEWYRSKLLSLRGIKRLLYILFYVNPNQLTKRVSSPKSH